MEGDARFGQASFNWLGQLKAHNDKAWFDAHKREYEQSVRAPMDAFLQVVQPVVGGTLKLFRQHRDTRFSADKSPYRTEMIGTLHGRDGSDAGLYVELSDRGLKLASGNHMWEKDQLTRYLTAMASGEGATAAETLAQLEADGWAIEGEMLKGVPKGYPADHPRGRFLKHKLLVAARHHPPAEVIAAGPQKLFDAFWQKVTPLNAWLDRHVGLSTSTAPARR